MYTNKKQMSNLRIGIDARGLSVKGGVSRYIKNLIIHLLALDKKNEYIIFNNSFFSVEFINKVKAKITIPFTSPFLRILQDQLILPLKCKNLDLIHYLKSFSPLIKRYKTIVSVHDIIPLTHPQFLSKLESSYWQKVIPLAIKNADKLLVPSYFVKEEILKKYKIKENKIKVIYYAYEKKFKVSTDKIILEKIKEKYQLPNQFILSVSSFSPRKNFKNLILAFAHLTKSIPHKLIIVGRSDKICFSLFKLIKELNLEKRVILLGFIPEEDLPYIYNLSSIFVYPSFIEGFGLPVLEAMASGIPVITSQIGSLPELVTEAAVLVNPALPYKIAEGIYKILNEQTLRENLIKKGLIRIKDFSWEKTAKETLKVYEELS